MKTEALGFLRRPTERLFAADTALGDHTFQRLQIHRRELSSCSQTVNGDVALMFPQERTHLLSELSGGFVNSAMRYSGDDRRQVPIPRAVHA